MIGISGDPIIRPDPCASIPEPSVVYDDIYEVAKNNGRDYTGEVWPKPHKHWIMPKHIKDRSIQ